MKRKLFKSLHLGKLALSIGICQLAGIVGSVATNSALVDWYSTLNKPSFTPPGYVIGAIWVTLFFLMGIALYLAWEKKVKLTWFWFQLGLNILWSFLFFGFRAPSWALLEIFFLWIAILGTIISFWPKVKAASILLFPYLAWVTIAAGLNYLIMSLN